MTKKTINVDKIKLEMDAWVKTEYGFLYQRNYQPLKEGLHRKDLAENHNLIGGMRWIGTYLQQKGVLDVFNGLADGYVSLAEGILFPSIMYKIHFETSQFLVNLFPDEVKDCYMGCYIFGIDEFLDILNVFLKRERHEEATPLSSFVKNLHKVHRGGPGEIRKLRSKVEPFDKVWRSWDDESVFAEALRGVCDYHLSCARVERYGLDRFLEPFSIFPLEIYAIRRLRQNLGLSMPQIDHPLLTTPIPLPPLKRIKVKDPLCLALHKKFKNFRGDIPEEVRVKRFAQMQPQSTVALQEQKPIKEKTKKEKPIKEKGKKEKVQKSTLSLEELIREGKVKKIEQSLYDLDMVSPIDWGADWDAIYDDFARRLDGDEMGAEFDYSDNTATLFYQNRKKVVQLPESADAQPKLIQAIDRIIRPDYEIRVLKASFHHDTYFCVLQKAEWWRSHDKQSKKIMKELFCPIAKLNER